MRKIIHIDMDCFYAGIEMRENPELREKPLAVGGTADRRGVLTTCNYPARRFGVRSAMPTYIALRRCPELTILPVRFDLYRRESALIRDILLEYTPVLEPLSLDEAYLDVSADPRPASEIATEIRKDIFDETGLTASAGIGPNKLLAKIASDWRKPDGQFEVKADDVAGFVADLPVRKLWGVGEVAARKLRNRGVISCGQLQRFSPPELERLFGKFGWELYELCRGIDSRPVEPGRSRKTLSTERTFSQNRHGAKACLSEAEALYLELEDDLRDKAEDREIRKLFVKIKFADFTQTTVERNGRVLSKKVYKELIQVGLKRSEQSVRLLGLGIKFAEGDKAIQLEFDLPGDPDDYRHGLTAPRPGVSPSRGAAPPPP